TWRCPHIALSAIPAYAVCSRLRLGSADSPQHSAESGSLSYGPPVRLRLLSTSPHGDAVTFDYEVMACLDADLHRADVMPSRAHGLRPPPERRGSSSSRRQAGIQTQDQRAIRAKPIGVGEQYRCSPPSEPYGRFSRIRLSGQWLSTSRLALKSVS